jgi:alkylhydroperoxidase family enzyme
MTRIAPLSPPYSREEQARFDAVMPPGMAPLSLFRVMARTERAWRKLVGGSLLDAGPLPLRAREIVIDRTCALSECEYEWGVHVSLFGQAAELTPAQIAATVHGGPNDPCWAGSDRALVMAADALHRRGALDADEFASLAAWFDEDQILETVQLCGFYRTIGYLVATLDLPLEPWAARFPAASPKSHGSPFVDGHP